MTDNQGNANEANIGTVPEKPVPRKRMRSPYLFPAYNFGLARQIAERVERAGAGGLTEGTLAMNLGLSAKSSGFQLKTLTARQFGLLSKQGGVLSTTPLAKAILKPVSEAEKKNALIDSFLTIPLFREVAARFKGQPLPATQDLRNILEREFGIDAKRVSDAERVLMDSAREADVLVSSGNNTYLSTERAATTLLPTKIDSTTAAAVAPGTAAGSSLPSPVAPPPISTPPSIGGMLTISEQDLAAFEDDQEFNEVWNALGKIVKARGKRLIAKERTSLEQPERQDSG